MLFSPRCFSCQGKAASRALRLGLALARCATPIRGANLRAINFADEFPLLSMAFPPRCAPSQCNDPTQLVKEQLPPPPSPARRRSALRRPTGTSGSPRQNLTRSQQSLDGPSISSRSRNLRRPKSWPPSPPTKVRSPPATSRSLSEAEASVPVLLRGLFPGSFGSGSAFHMTHLLFAALL